MRDLGVLFILVLITASAWKHDALIYPPLIYLGVYLLALYLRRHRERARTIFLNQLKTHRAELRSGGTIVVNNQLLKYDSMLTTYRVQVGGIISSVTIPSHYKRSPDEDRHESIIYSLCTLFSGWWHLPTGPLETIAIIVENLRGGERKSIAQLIDGRLLERLEERRQAAASKAPEKKPIHTFGEDMKNNQRAAVQKLRTEGAPKPAGWKVKLIEHAVRVEARRRRRNSKKKPQ